MEGGALLRVFHGAPLGQLYEFVFESRFWVFHAMDLLEEPPIVVDVERQVVLLTSKLGRVVVVSGDDLGEVFGVLLQESGRPEISNLPG